MRTLITIILSALVLSASAQMHHFHVDFGFKVDTANLVLGDTYVDGNGRNFNISMANFYVSNVRLIKADSTEISYSQYLLVQNNSVTSGSNETMLGMIDDNGYIGIKFDLGLDSATNHMDPSNYTTGDPLANQNPSMHWAWNSGYIFSRFEGMYDTTSVGGAAPNSGFEYHVGMDNMLRTIELYFASPVTLTSTDGMLMLDINLDMMGVLNNVDLLTENSTHTMDNMPLAMKITNNLANSFSVTAMKTTNPTGIDKVTELEGHLFPNPATSQATLQFNNPGEDYTLQVLDLTGRVVFQQNDITGNRVDINTADLNSGMYLLHLTGATGNYSTRLMVK